MMNNNRPTFLVIGAQKSGTTWLHRFFQTCPDVFVPVRKELMYFDNRNNYNTLGWEWYIDNFSAAEDASAIGEVTPGYLWTSGEQTVWGCASEFRRDIPARVRDMLGSEVQLIVLLRNPINRALSAFMHHRRMQRISPDKVIDEYLKFGGIGNMGFYAKHLDHWRKWFSKDRFFIGTYEDMFSSSDITDSILEFVGAKPVVNSGFVNQRFNVGLGFVRDSDGAIDGSGKYIATSSSIEYMQKVYYKDVMQLKRDWGVNKECWEADFRCSTY